ncbi:MAG: hypothetical protein EB829_02840 [Nitrosopumilus sp. H8]|nr:MAG: hypothetical protein EB829_02840 [Nitrosopumilus sp. H8]
MLCTDISHTVMLVPRLKYSGILLDGIIDSLQEARDSLHTSNKHLADCEELGKCEWEALKSEAAVMSALEAITKIKRKAGQISGVMSIPEVLPASIQVVRTVSASLYEMMPDCSQRLSELSVHLGSIVLDSAAITQARFDFGRSNSESSDLLDEAKLIADSKLKKQYPNLDFSEADTV